MGGIGNVLGTVAGGVGGFLLGGPVGAVAGASLGNSLLGGSAGDAAAGAATDAAGIQAQYQREALDYLKEKEALPREYSEAAITQMGGTVGIGDGNQQEIIDRALASPLYGAIMGGQEAGEDAILRNASATGGLRSGNVQSNLYDYNVQLQNKALLESYNQQMTTLHGLSGLPTMAPQIAQQTGAIGTTLAQGITAAAQAQQAASQNSMGNLMGLGNLGIAAYGAGMFSDRRLKKNIKKIGEYKGRNWYSWDWNIVAQKMGLKGNTVGCMADEVYATNPEAILIKNLFMMIDYAKIGILKPYCEVR